MSRGPISLNNPCGCDYDAFTLIRDHGVWVQLLSDLIAHRRFLASTSFSVTDGTEGVVEVAAFGAGPASFRSLWHIVVNVI